MYLVIVLSTYGLFIISPQWKELTASSILQPHKLNLLKFALVFLNPYQIISDYAIHNFHFYTPLISKLMWLNT